jgi:hypothetical protein
MQRVTVVQQRAVHVHLPRGLTVNGSGQPYRRFLRHQYRSTGNTATVKPARKAQPNTAVVLTP